MKTVYCCWKCNKEYSTSIYPPYDQRDKLVLCDCGGQIVSNSGKVMLKRVMEESDYINEINNLKHKLKQCERITNNVLYFDDNSDYSTALWQVLNVTQDRNVHDDYYDVKLDYMEEE